MKFLVMMAYIDYEGGYPTGAFIVPDDFDQQEAFRQWREETFKPAKWKNQYGEGETMKYQGQPSMPFLDWLRENHVEAEVVECDF